MEHKKEAAKICKKEREKTDREKKEAHNRFDGLIKRQMDQVNAANARQTSFEIMMGGLLIFMPETRKEQIKKR